MDARIRKRRRRTNTENQKPEKDLFIPNDLFFKFFVSLPAETLVELQYHCKQWYSLINSSDFIRAHATQPETVLIYRFPLGIGPPTTFYQLEDGRYVEISYSKSTSVESSSNLNVKSSCIEASSTSVESSSNLNVKSSCIEASCDGMILLSYKDNETRKLKLTNPLTRKQEAIEIPLECPRDYVLGCPRDYKLESFGMAYCNEAKTYKVVHLYDERSLVSSCEILSLDGSRSWTRINGPNISVNHWKIPPVCIGGSLHWLSHLSYKCASFNVCDENFVIRKLPSVNYNADWSIFATNPKLVEINGYLGYVDLSSCEDSLKVWILKEDCWIEWKVIWFPNGLGPCVPICGWKNGREMLLQTNYFARLYAYNYERGEFKAVIFETNERHEFKAVKNEGKHEGRTNYFLYRKTLIWYDTHTK